MLNDFQQETNHKEDSSFLSFEEKVNKEIYTCTIVDQKQMLSPCCIKQEKGANPGSQKSTRCLLNTNFLSKWVEYCM